MILLKIVAICGSIFRRHIAVLIALVLTCCHSSNDVPTVEVRPSSHSSSSTIEPGADDQGGLLRFAVMGDWGAGTQAQRDIAAEMCRIRKERPFELIVTTGDNFYPRGTASDSNFKSPESCLLAEPNLVWKPVWGNHDATGLSTRDIWGAPRYYSFREKGVTFIMLDSNQAASSGQRDWLEAQLSLGEPGPKMVVFHHPPYTVGSVHHNDAGVQTAWVPLLKKYRVALVLNGHNHDYEHSRVKGIDYVVSGGGGAALYGCARKETWLMNCKSAHHFLLIEVTNDHINVQAIESFGEIIDQFDVGSTTAG